MQKSKDEMIDWVWRLVKSYGDEGESNLFYLKISFLAEASGTPIGDWDQPDAHADVCRLSLRHHKFCTGGVQKMR
jgi:hypothetical protein